MKLVCIFKAGKPNESLITKALFLMRILRSDYLMLLLMLPPWKYSKPLMLLKM